jgi:glycine cleavage system H protein
MYPENLKYTKEHEWIEVEGDRAKVGITEYAQQQLGDVVYVELPEIGASFSTAAVFGSIESVKAVSELFCPVGGEVVDINQDVVDSPELVNQAPHDKAWLMVIKMTDPSVVETLLSASDYQKYVEEEAGD